MARLTLLGIAETGIDIEVFVDSARSEFLEQLAQRPNVSVTALATRWRYGRWYSSFSLASLASGTASRVHIGAKLAARLAERHAERPFDAVYRLSQIELLALRPLRDRLPPIVLHPEVHAYGELRHHWRERSLALRGGGRSSFAVTHAYLAYRSLVQRRDVGNVAALIAPSARFAEHLVADYHVPRERIRVIPNAIDLDRFYPGAVAPPRKPVRLLFISRLSVRKGVEQVVELSHRLQDLAGEVQIDCLGGPSLFSNYSALLKDLNPAVARHLGHLPTTELPALYRSAHVCIQPSMYEPFALTVGEALASGLPVVVSDEVGAGEGVDPRVCRVHRAGDVAGMEREVRRLIDQIRRGWDPRLRHVARQHAEQHFSRQHFGHELVDVLRDVRRSPPEDPTAVAVASDSASRVPTAA